ncbi:unnamed protein product [Paramecium sonneborni]|uniref:Uncharacterized protein n=1 Tax=Paramecium sonneborni TaxID=65129 RepID=A0A8S1R3J6_9CILI|nr:unnamed protein product [Paramecium sonneborni]
MNFLIGNPSNGQQSNQNQQRPIEYEVDILNKRKQRLVKTKIQVKFSSYHQIIYSKDEAILKIEQFYDIFNIPKIMNNMEQLRYLTFQGRQVWNYKKIGKWFAIWDKKSLVYVGGYYMEGQKQGLWKELIKNYWSKAEVLKIGEYKNDNRIGKWSYIYKNMEIDGGYYNLKSKKTGKWIELDERFYDLKQVTFNGEYNQNGKKSGRWNINYCAPYGDEKYKEIGGGLYDKEDDQKKIGRWIELDEQFEFEKQVTYSGEYNKKGIKVGRWDTWFKIVQNKQIGGGSYDKEGGLVKIGRWIELDEGFDRQKQVTYSGEYDIQGRKVGRWDTAFDRKQIGGGSYNKEEIKIGIWIELDEECYDDRQITYNGEYSMNGKKIGRWDIVYNRKQIGGGSYDQEGIKIGMWIELDEGFYNDKQVTYIGEYDMQGKKQGKWGIFFRWEYEKDYNKIGGGSYSQKGDQQKIGRWIELVDGFRFGKQVTYSGEYNTQGIKEGRWNLSYKVELEKDYKQIGGGSYSNKGKKTGQWIELDDEFEQRAQITYRGKYNINSIKIGMWETWLNYFDDGWKNIQIGGGSYDDSNECLKTGRWIDLGEGFDQMAQVTYNGEYNTKGMKVGKWSIWWNQNGEDKEIGGGSYDESGQGIKIGRWVESGQGFWKSKQVTYCGEYNIQGIKTGRWDIQFNDTNNKQIGGGQYDYSGKGIKTGRWVEVDWSFGWTNQIIFSGEYNMKGLKIGLWLEVDIYKNKILNEKKYYN